MLFIYFIIKAAVVMSFTQGKRAGEKVVRGVRVSKKRLLPVTVSGGTIFSLWRQKNQPSDRLLAASRRRLPIRSVRDVRTGDLAACESA